MVCFHANSFATQWTDEEKNWFIASNVFLVTDWATTRNISKRYHEGYHEKNKFLGKYPSTERVNRHFVSALILNYLMNLVFITL